MSTPLNNKYYYLRSTSSAGTQTAEEPLLIDFSDTEVESESEVASELGAHRAEEEDPADEEISEGDDNSSQVSIDEEDETTMAQVHMPNFHGNAGESATEWFVWYANYADILNYNADKRRLTMPFFFKDHALAFYSSLSAEVKRDFDRIKEAIIERFDEADDIDHDMEILSLSQYPGESTASYFTRILKATNNKGYPESLLVSIVLKGLQADLKQIVMPQNLRTVEALRKAASLAEKTVAATNTGASVAAAFSDIVTKQLQGLTDKLSQIEMRQGSDSSVKPPSTWRRNNGNKASGGKQRTHPELSKDSCFRCGEGFTGSGSILYILILFGLLGLCSGTNMFQRLNYGVVFKETDKVLLAKDFWYHTFEIQLPDSVSIPLLTSCSTRNLTCSVISPIMIKLNTVRSETSARLNSTLRTIQDLIPENLMHKSRSQRSLLPFIGKLSKGLFGTATMDDVNILAEHMNKLNKMTLDISKALTQHEDHLSSFISAANQRMDNLLSGIKNNMIQIQIIQTELHATVNNLEYSMEYLMEILIDQMQASISLNHQLEEFKLGVISLVNGDLSPLLIPSNVLQSTLEDIQQMIQIKYTGFHLSVTDVNEVYSSCKYIFARNDTKLYVTLKLPISNYKTPLTLYDVLSMPVPINSSSVDATQLLDLPKMFLVTTDQQYYAAFDHFDRSKCSGTHVKFCSQNIALSPVTTQSCILALFANDKVMVKSMCAFKYVQSVIRPQIMELAPNSLLLYRTSLLSMECSQEHKMVQGCDFCLFKLPCRCSISTNEHYFAPRLASCHKSFDNVTVLHPVNLVLLQHFFDASITNEIFADTTFRSPINVTIPSLKIYQHEMSNVLAADTKAHLNLSKMADIAKQDGIIFQSLTEPLLENHIQLKSDWPDLNGILLIGTIGATVFLSVLLFWTIYKVRKLSAALIILQHVQQVKAFPTQVPSFIYNSNVAKQIDQVNDIFAIDLTWDHANFFMICFLIAIIVLYIWKRTRNHNISRLCLEVSSGKHYVLLDVHCLPMCHTHYDIMVPAEISELTIENSCFSHYLTVSWPGFTVRNKLTNTMINVKSRIKIDYFTSRKLKKILAQPFFVYLYKGHSNVVIPL